MNRIISIENKYVNADLDINKIYSLTGSDIKLFKVRLNKGSESKNIDKYLVLDGRGHIYLDLNILPKNIRNKTKYKMTYWLLPYADVKGKNISFISCARRPNYSK